MIIHSQGHYGSSGEIKERWILPHLEYGPKSVIDYGCGRCNVVNKLGIEDVYKYDPAILEYSVRPERKFDLLICTDVLEHIPENCLDLVLEDIHDLSNYAFFTICTRLAAKILPNGENAHQTVKSADWWQKKINKHFNISDLVLVGKEGCHIKTWM